MMIPNHLYFMRERITNHPSPNVAACARGTLTVSRNGLRDGTIILRVDTATADDGEQDGGFREVLRRDLGEVSGKNNEIGILAGFKFALLPFLDLCVRGTGGVGANAVVEGNFFLRLPSARGTAFRQLARHASIETAHGTKRLDVIVRAESETRATF